MACITQEINAKRAIHWGYVMPYEIGLVFRFSRLHTCFSLYFCSLSCACFQLSLWPLHILFICFFSRFSVFLRRLQLLLVLISSLTFIGLSTSVDEMCSDLVKWLLHQRERARLKPVVSESSANSVAIPPAHLHLAKHVLPLRNITPAISRMSGCVSVGGCGSCCFLSVYYFLLLLFWGFCFLVKTMKSQSHALWDRVPHKPSLSFSPCLFSLYHSPT